jgi:phosphatidylglycerophosphate synthase
LNVWIDTQSAGRGERLFSLDPVERHLRALAKVGSEISVILSGPAVALSERYGLNITADVSDAPAGLRLRQAVEHGPVLAIDGATAVDPRLLRFLLHNERSRAAFGGEGQERAAVLRLDRSMTDHIDPKARSVLAAAEALVQNRHVDTLQPEEFPSFVPNLRRSVDFWLFAVPDEAARKEKERWLFWSNYKGSTDFLTRWVYPPIVWPSVQLLTRFRVHPNWVTILSVILAFACVPFFAKGDFVTGLLLAYLMTILDSVDGKVARLTLTDSALGNILDHGLDIVHPPLWYFAWAYGLGAAADSGLFNAAALLVAFYVADRIVLGIAKARFGRGLHAMTSLDGAVRTWIARRNVNMAILTVALLAGAGAAGFYLVVAWQGITLAWHLFRTVWLSPQPAENARGAKPSAFRQ